MQNDTQNQQFIKHLLAVAPKHCDNCGSKYAEHNFKVIKSTPAGTVFHLKCESCNNAYMLNVMSPVNGMVGAQRSPMNVDLAHGEEVQKFAGQDAIHKNEALDSFKFVSDQASKNDIQNLFI